MKQVNLAIVGGSYADETRPYDQQDTVNYIPEQAESDGARSRGILRGVPGFDYPAVSLGSSPIRGSRDVEDVSYHVCGTTLYKCIPTGPNTIASTSLGTIPGNGRCSISHNQITGGHEIIVVNGLTGGGYVYNDVTSVFTQITDPDFFGALCVDYIDQYFVLVKPNGDEFYNSDLAAGLSYNSLNTYEAEADPDRIVGLIVNHEEIWVMGRKTIQPFYSSGQLDGLFLPLQGAVIQQGCAGTFAYCNLDNSVFWLDDIGIFRRANGYTPVRISTHPIEQAIIGLDWSQVFCFTWSDRGHQVIYWTFPDGHTWGYDVSSGQWHRRESYTNARWRISTLIFTAGRWLAGDAYNGNLYWLDWNVFAENGQPLIAQRRSAYQHDSGNKLTLNRLELFMDMGATRTVQPFLRQYPPTVSVDPTPTAIQIHGTPQSGVVGAPYTFTWTATGGTGTGYVFTKDSGTLPAGTALDQTVTSTDDTLEGTPTTATTYDFVLRVTDSGGNTTTANEEIVIQQALYVMVGTGGNVTTTPDFVTYNHVSVGVSNALNAICRSGTTMVTVSDSTPTKAYIFTSADNGGTWTSRTPPVTNQDITGCDSGLGKVIACTHPGGLLDGLIFVSANDGVSWSQISAPGGCGSFTSVKFNGTLFVLTSSLGKVTTCDGTTATLHTGGSNDISSCYNSVGMEWLMVGSAAETYTAPAAGFPWTYRSAQGGATYSFYSVVDGYVSGEYMAAANGNGGTSGIWHSTDSGNNWIQVYNSGIAFCVTRFNGQYLAGTTTAVLASATGANGSWVSHTLPAGYQINAIYAGIV